MPRATSKIACTTFLIASLCGGAGSVSAQGGGAQRYTKAVTPLLDAAGGKAIGSLGPGATLDVLGQSGGATQVAVHGWSAQGADGTVFVAPDRHIVELSGFTGHVVASTSQTVAGTVYNAVTVDGWVPDDALVADVRDVWKSADGLYAHSCGSCHALPAPSSYSANQWPAIMKTQAPNAALEPNDAALITTYLQNQSGH